MANYKVADADQLDTALGTIADAIREQTGKTEQIPFPNGFASAPVEIFAAGKAESDALWGAKYHATTMRGTDKCNISFPLPFKPDLIYVSFFDPFAIAENNTWCGIARDFRSFARYGGFLSRHGTDSGLLNTVVQNATIGNYISTSDEGVLFTAPSSMTSFLWRKEATYLVIAVNYSDGKTDAELLSDYVLGLPESGGSLILSQKRFNDTGMTDTEWAELIAKQPNWTFGFE